MIQSNLKMKIFTKQFLIIIIIGCFILLPLGPNARAESINLVLRLDLPNEGETFYSGPSTLLYNIPIEGQVSSPGHDPREIQVKIEILQDLQVVASQDVNPDGNGKFRIYAQVNPGAYVENFVAELIPCGDRCHVHPSDSFSRHEWDASFSLPPGVMIISVTAIDPDGNTANLERNITVDRSHMVDIPIRVVFFSSSDLPLEGIPISASTWLYMWRSRIFSGGTNSDGNATLQVEALSERATNYRFEVKPTVLNGILYESVSPVDITLVPGGNNIPKITLVIKASLASIQGRISGDQVPSELTIWAIPDDNGNILTTEINGDGTFEFKEIPINQYTITTDKDSLATLGYSLKDVKLDLSKNTNPIIEMNITKLDGFICQGIVLDNADNPIPFSWGTIEGDKNPVESRPDTGKFSILNLADGNMTYIVNAPGYYSQAKVISPGSETCSEIKFNLSLKPESREIAWGSGKITVPAESVISQSGNSIFIERGWLWGNSIDIEPIILQSGNLRIQLENGRFALQNLPGLTQFFILIEGSGSIQPTSSSSWSPIPTGTLILLENQPDLVMMPIESTLITHYLRSNISPIMTSFEPTFIESVLSRLALLGIDAAKLITFVTYAIVLISIMLLPIIMLIRWRRKQKLQKEN